MHITWLQQSGPLPKGHAYIHTSDLGINTLGDRFSLHPLWQYNKVPLPLRPRPPLSGGRRCQGALDKAGLNGQSALSLLDPDQGGRAPYGPRTIHQTPTRGTCPARGNTCNQPQIYLFFFSFYTFFSFLLFVVSFLVGWLCVMDMPPASVDRDCVQCSQTGSNPSFSPSPSPLTLVFLLSFRHSSPLLMRLETFAMTNVPVSVQGRRQNYAVVL